MIKAVISRWCSLAAALGAGLGMFLFAASAAAQEGSPTPIGTFRDWSAYMIEEANRQVCFVVSEPKSKNLSNPDANRGDPFFLVTRWGEGQTPQPSVLIGYPQDSDSRTKVTIGSTVFEMFVDKDGAWMETEEQDKKLTEAMRKGATMTVEGVSSRGTKSTDRYSLSGVSAALDKILETCQ